ncbi:hypothetical protein Esi_0006_0159 [Ectocarpus siliculosus]|uniref:Uncharacterized protein n=1 Tax=Ectocarpus siliculosus TaxID=2880 RepID=D8LQK2_ECTSI|nr:hypothetical protein Esi_0006_0159 [Ectocarpus siliculosus]|eukprot:CBN78766.1 hypothetical protein Esi_0006_0159 [Ectocarpus siliculosus]
MPYYEPAPVSGRMEQSTVWLATRTSLKRSRTHSRVSATGPASAEPVTDDATAVVSLKPPPSISLGMDHAHKSSRGE